MKELIDKEILNRSPNSYICSIIYEYFFDLFHNSLDYKNIIDNILKEIDVYEYNNTILFGILSASNFKEKELDNYYLFLNKIKDKINNENIYSESELKKMFYGLE